MSETIQEYLVALGFNLDEHSWRRFSEGTNRATQLVQNLGIGATAAAAAVSVAVEQIAHRYEDLYYASQRTGESVKGLLSFEYAARQIGLTAGQARGAVEGFAMSLRMSPGLHGLLKQYGVSATQPVEQMQQLVANLKQTLHMPYYTAARIGGIFGMDEHTFVQMWNNVERMTEAGDRYRNMLKNAGLDSQVVAEDSVRLGRAMSSLGASFDILGTKILHGLIGPMEKIVSGISGTIEQFTSNDPAASRAAFDKEHPEYLGTGAQSMLGRKYPRLHSYLSKGYQDLKGMSGGYKSARDETVRFFMSQGWSREQALGIAANLAKESSFSTTGTGDGGRAYGLAQWHPDRQADFAQWAGHDIHGSSFQEQLGFVQYELAQGKEQKAGRALKGAKTAFDSAAVFSQGYERPLRTIPEMQARGNLAQQWGDAGVVNINITVNGKADPAEITRSVKDGLNFVQRRQFIRHGSAVR